MIGAALRDSLRRLGDRPAYTCGGSQLSGEALWARAARLAQFLAARNPDRRPVLLYGHKQWEMPVGIVACIAAGMPYMPVDSGTPEPRIEDMARTANCALALCADPLALPGIPCVDGDAIAAICADGPVIATPAEPDPDDPCYILFTSGSSGQPKGVPISYGNLRCFLDWMDALPAIRESNIHTALNQAPFSFDLSVADLLWGLWSGRAVVALERAQPHELAPMFDAMGRSHAELLVLTPSFARYCLLDRSFGRALLPDLQAVFLCGETLTSAIAKKLFDRFPGVRILNAYGPTETAVAVCAAEITPAMLGMDELPIALGSCPAIRLLDRDLHEVPDGTQGEIVIAGPMVSRGYLGGVSGGFATIDGTHAYRTGDGAVRRGDALYFAGRLDRQLKRGGFRIEPAEIEHHIRAQPHIAACAVLAAGNTAAVRLIAFVEFEHGHTIAPDALREALAQRLPAYLLPDRIVAVDTMPVTANGKLDTAALLGRV